MQRIAIIGFREAVRVLGVAAVGLAVSCAGQSQPKRIRTANEFWAKHKGACTSEGYPGIGFIEESTLPPASAPSSADVTSIRKVLADNRSSTVGSCYCDALGPWPSLEGRMRISLVIEADGSVSHARVLESSACPRSLGCCIANQHRKLRFPKPENGRTLYTMQYVLRTYWPARKSKNRLRAQPASHDCTPLLTH